ncbi:hypothetical protein A2641_01290 [Candidatus Nomurabacteria bacterium RIFCSPHIGHO2_01_FULL_37_25]|uniref:Uncharacterized protein n=1 Tax=Candidatus Nomurabacteria bacterium RIFCSPLOWO2_01_FULL_36_16 TaxID=1801767 RepID=A0A1F6WZE3_9BACT|nr:MAG: hypothetical protein A2641_01290 [Candidatus Nomurabacteria bacterium RIFCSPHIGHO2_01_FULL_37_25]OGI75348.1 MAG: hypothetical protein A3D36_02190 [Candidatus Nomurabacteria bacterium RIFCSPHIGHO2_02_FULL_36_29]OGI87095.1 MAG: hypothetical protein A3A91_00285 [Candidatus Nomurabacteria bacterium RIFCSPLOWO2_01_FULL_36_16]
MAPKKTGGQKGGLLWTITILYIRSVYTVSVLTMGPSGMSWARSVWSQTQGSSVRRHTGLLGVVESRWRGVKKCRLNTAKNAGEWKIMLRTTTLHSAFAVATISLPTRTSSRRDGIIGVAGEIS